MLKFLLKKPFFTKGFLIFIAILTITVISLFFTYKNYIKNNQKILVKNAVYINEFIEGYFGHTKRVHNHIGNQIVNNNSDDLHFIHDLFITQSHILDKQKLIFSWSSFDWINHKGLQVINSELGIRKNPPDMLNRKYLQDAPKNPWVLQVSPPVIGKPSKNWVIPVATGVTNDKGKYLGSIVVGFNVEEFTNKIADRLSDGNSSKNIDFLVLDRDLNVILQSKNNNLERDINFYQDVLKEFNPFYQNSAFLENKIKIGKVIYHYYHKMDNYPYIILTGFDE